MHSTYFIKGLSTLELFYWEKDSVSDMNQFQTDCTQAESLSTELQPCPWQGHTSDVHICPFQHILKYIYNIKQKVMTFLIY